jgi:SSS family solute:Na+ symporter
MTLLPFLVVLLISIGTCYFTSRQKGDYFLADRSIGWLPLFGSFLGTQVGVGFVLGGTDSVWERGIEGCFYGFGLAVGMLVLSLGYSKRLRMLNVSTLPDLLEKRYKSPGFRKLATAISIFSLGGILVAQAVGLQKFLISLGYSSETLFLLLWGSVVLYTMFGGLRALVWVDLIQAFTIVAILVATFYWSIFPHWSEVRAGICMPGDWNEQTFSLLLMPIFYIFVGEHMAQRCFSAKTPKIASQAAMATALSLLLLLIVPLSCGILARSFNISSEKGSIFMQVMQLLTNPVLFTFASCAVLLAIVSTTSAILLAVSSNLTQDTRLENGKMITFFVGMAAILGAAFGSDIIAWIVAGYEVSVGALLIPLLVAVFSSKDELSSSFAWGSAICGFMGVFISYHFLSGIWYTLTPLLLSSAGFSICWAYKEIIEKQTVASQMAIE